MEGVRFKNLIIRNGRVFDDVVIPLENQGLVSIQGDNGVGKSSIWDLLEAILYGSTPNGYKKDELTRNNKDCHFEIQMERDGGQYSAALRRINKKWSYSIFKDGIDITSHTYYDNIKAVGEIVGLTKDEFEGSVHLTQDAQHMLIKGTLGERKDYISNFFGIDNRYDEVQTAAKSELEKVSEKIQRLSALSHSKQMLETQLQNLQFEDIEPLRNKAKTLQTNLDKMSSRLSEIDRKLRIWDEYDRHYCKSVAFENPETLLLSTEKNLNDARVSLARMREIHERNERAKETNSKIASIRHNLDHLRASFPNLETETQSPDIYDQEILDLETAKRQNARVSSLRDELARLPNVKEIPIQKIEEELVALQVAYQTCLKNKIAKEKGICSECGSKFTKQDVQSDIEKIREIKENIDLLSQDYSIVKARNQNAKRREWILDQLRGVPEFSKEKDARIEYLKNYVKALKLRKSYCDQLGLLHEAKIEEISGFEGISKSIEDLECEKKLLEECLLAKKLMPEIPDESRDALILQKTECHAQILNLKTFLNSTNEAIGQRKTANETRERVEKQLSQIKKQLEEVDDLKKDEFFWSKMVDAYGPKGLRIQQLEKMMDLILHQMPVYVSILFNEKNLVFKHKVDANNVKILASRQILGKSEKTTSFEHDIGAFSGGEKDLMSASFILTLADCVPSRKRANILVLDEIDSQFDEGIKFRFTNELLPLLKKKYSSIFVISHDKNVQLANIYDQIWSLTKKNHASTLTMQTL